MLMHVYLRVNACAYVFGPVNLCGSGDRCLCWWICVCAHVCVKERERERERERDLLSTLFAIR